MATSHSAGRLGTKRRWRIFEEVPEEERAEHAGTAVPLDLTRSSEGGDVASMLTRFLNHMRDYVHGLQQKQTQEVNKALREREVGDVSTAEFSPSLGLTLGQFAFFKQQAKQTARKATGKRAPSAGKEGGDPKKPAAKPKTKRTKRSRKVGAV